MHSTRNNLLASNRHAFLVNIKKDPDCSLLISNDPFNLVHKSHKSIKVKRIKPNKCLRLKVLFSKIELATLTKSVSNVMHRSTKSFSNQMAPVYN